MKKYILILFLILYSIKNNAQDLKSEFGLIAGATSMQTDYGERGHFGSSYANMGFGFGGVFYLSFDNIRKRWNDRTTGLKDHIRLRAEISYMKTNLKQRGKYTQGTSSQTVLYNAMRGTSTMLNYGGQLEYTIFGISSKQNFDPYLSIGFLANSNTPQLESELGDINTNPNLIPNVYNDGVFLEKNNSTSLILGVGARMKPKDYNSKSIYLVDFRWQRFNSDIVDGLAPKLSANKFNDWLLFISFGYIFNLN